MAKVLCELTIKNAKNGTRAIGRSILGPKQTGIVKFYSVGQIQDALRLEKRGGIKIMSPIPKDIKGLDVQSDEEVATVNPGVAQTPEQADEVLRVETEKLEGDAKEAKEAEEQDIPFAMSREEVIGKGKKELLAIAREKGIELPGINSRSAATEVTNALLEHFGHDVLAEGEKA